MSTQEPSPIINLAHTSQFVNTNSSESFENISIPAAHVDLVGSTKQAGLFDQGGPARR